MDATSTVMNYKGREPPVTCQKFGSGVAHTLISRQEVYGTKWSETEQKWSETEQKWSETEQKWSETEQKWSETEQKWSETEQKWSETELK